MYLNKQFFAALMASWLTTAGFSETWVTIRKVDVDRCASAWLIKRFIDESPEFRFFNQGEEAPGGIGYDFFGAKYFHKGSDCTFTRLIKVYGFSEIPALRRMNEDVNDVFSWRWPSGSFPVKFREHIGDLRAANQMDLEVFEDLYATFDLLYWSYGGKFEDFKFESASLHRTFFLRLIYPYFECINEPDIVGLSEDALIRTAKGDKLNSAWMYDNLNSVRSVGPDAEWLQRITELEDSCADGSISHNMLNFRRKIIERKNFKE